MKASLFIPHFCSIFRLFHRYIMKITGHFPLCSLEIHDPHIKLHHDPTYPTLPEIDEA